MNPQGGGVSAWPSADAQGDPAVAVREDFPSGAVQTALVSGGAGGEVGELAVGRSGLGDGLVAFRQGPLGNAAIVAAAGHALRPRAVRREHAQGLGQALAGAGHLGTGRQRRRAAALPASCSTAACCRRPPAPSSCAWIPRGLGTGRHTRAGARDRHRRPVDAHGALARC